MSPLAHTGWLIELARTHSIEIVMHDGAAVTRVPTERSLEIAFRPRRIVRSVLISENAIEDAVDAVKIVKKAVERVAVDLRRDVATWLMESMDSPLELFRLVPLFEDGISDASRDALLQSCERWGSALLEFVAKYEGRR